MPTSAFAYWSYLWLPPAGQPSMIPRHDYIPLKKKMRLLRGNYQVDPALGWRSFVAQQSGSLVSYGSMGWRGCGYRKLSALHPTLGIDFWLLKPSVSSLGPGLSLKPCLVMEVVCDLWSAANVMNSRKEGGKAYLKREARLTQSLCALLHWLIWGGDAVSFALISFNWCKTVEALTSVFAQMVENRHELK